MTESITGESSTNQAPLSRDLLMNGVENSIVNPSTAKITSSQKHGLSNSFSDRNESISIGSTFQILGAAEEALAAHITSSIGEACSGQFQRIASSKKNVSSKYTRQPFQNELKSEVALEPMQNGTSPCTKRIFVTKDQIMNDKPELRMPSNNCNGSTMVNNKLHNDKFNSIDGCLPSGVFFVNNDKDNNLKEYSIISEDLNLADYLRSSGDHSKQNDHGLISNLEMISQNDIFESKSIEGNSTDRKSTSLYEKYQEIHERTLQDIAKESENNSSQPDPKDSHKIVSYTDQNYPSRSDKEQSSEEEIPIKKSLMEINGNENSVSPFVNQIDHEIPHPRLSPSTEVFLANSEDLVYQSMLCESNNSNEKQGIQCHEIVNNIPTKSFLKKGSRREPAALHRFKSTNHEDPSKENKDNDITRKKKLEELEKMQKDQVAQLETRLKRREDARKEIMVQRRRELEKNKYELSSKIVEQKLDTHRNESLCNEDTQPIEDSAHFVEPVNSALKVSEKENKNLFINNNKSATEKSCKKRTYTRYETKLQHAHARSPLNNTKCNIMNSNSLEQSMEAKEQWRIIKSMRKRQESALTAAEREREEVRSWAESERAKVKKWVENQRSLVQKEKQRCSNAVMASQRQRKREELEERAVAANINNQKQARVEIETLKSSIHKLKVEADAERSRQRLSEKRLRNQIGEKDRTIKYLNDEILRLKDKNHELVVSRDKLLNEKFLLSDKKKNMKKKHTKRVDCPLSIDTSTDNEKSCTKDKKLVLTEPQSEAREDFIQKKEFDTMKTPDQRENVLNKINENKKYEDEKLKEAISNLNHVVENDPNTMNVIASFKDLVEEPTEHWLRRYIQGNQSTSCSYHKEILEEFDSKFTGDCSKICCKKDNVCSSSDSNKGKLDSRHLKFESPSNDALISLHEKDYNPIFYSQSQISHEEVLTDSNNKTLYVDQESHQSKASANFLEVHKDNNREEIVLPDGRKLVSYGNGTRKEILVDGTTIVRFTNGDIKTTYANVGIIVYYYAEAKTSHTSHPDGLEILEFANGQIERHYPSGKKEINFYNGTTKFILPDGKSETNFPDGVHVIELPNGSKEIKRL